MFVLVFKRRAGIRIIFFMSKPSGTINLNSGRIPQLDGVRGLAIVMVLLWHYIERQWSAGHAGVSIPVVGPALSIMWGGVDLFFVLSGFLIIGILVDHRNSPQYFRTFYLRRICRIFPVYYLVLVAFLIVKQTHLLDQANYPWLLRGAHPIWSYATFTQNIFMGSTGEFGPHWLAPTWSLALEEQFYIIVPLLIYLLPRSAFVMLCVVGIMDIPMVRASFPGMVSFVNLPFRADSLMFGGLLALIVRVPGFMGWADRFYRWFIVLALVLVADLAVLMFINGRALGMLDHTLLGLISAFIIFLALLPSARALGSVLSNRALVWLGVRSYSIYLLHQGISGFIHGLFHHPGPVIYGWQDALVMLSALGITLVLAALSYRFIEQPCMRFGRKFKYDVPARPTT